MVYIHIYIYVCVCVCVYTEYQPYIHIRIQIFEMLLSSATGDFVYAVYLHVLMMSLAPSTGRV